MVTETTAGPTSSAGRAAVLTATTLGLALSMFNSTIVNTTIPEIGPAFHASSSELQWISSLYTLCYAALLLPGGALSHRLGRRAAFLLGIAGFALGCLMCSVAPSLAVMLTGRVVQAVGAAAMLPQTLTILVFEYADPAARARAVGIWAGGASLGLSAGPVLGGVIVSISSWRFCFGLSMLLAVVTLSLGWTAIPGDRHGRPAQSPPIDVRGACLSATALAALVFGLIESTDRGWASPVILASLAAFVVLLTAFVLLEHRLGVRDRNPLMPLRLWRSGGFVAANVAALVYFITFFAVLYFYSIDLQDARGHSALVAGLAFLPMTLVMAAVGPVAGRLVAAYGALRVLVAGLAVAAAGCVLLAFLAHDASLLDLEWRFAVVGAGAGLISSPASTAAVSSVPAAVSGSASAVYNTVRQLGSTLGVAAVGVIVGATDAPGFANRLDRAMVVLACLLAAAGLLCVALAGAGHTPRAGRRAPR